MFMSIYPTTSFQFVESHFNPFWQLHFCFFPQPTFPPIGPGILWAPRSCCWSFFLDTNLFGHNEHWKFFSPVWYLSCTSRDVLPASILSQYLHFNLGNSWRFSWALSSPLPRHRLPQYLHKKSVECTIFWWPLTLFAVSKIIGHEGHRNFAFSCTRDLWSLRPDLEPNFFSHLSQHQNRSSTARPSSPLAAWSRRWALMWYR